MTAKPLPSPEFLRQCFAYDPNTGDLVWRTRPREHFETGSGWRIFNGRNAGKPAGSLIGSGLNSTYLAVAISPVRYLAHRIIWAIVYGADPGDMSVDHIDRNGLNNRLFNLRLATNAENSRNKPALRTDKLKGAYFRKDRGKWCARIGHDGKFIYIGQFETEQEAHEAYRQAARKLHGDFACLHR